MKFNKFFNKKKSFDRKIKSKEQLISMFIKFEKRKRDFSIGIEYEKFLLNKNLYSLNFFKKTGMQEFLIFLKKIISLKTNKKYNYIFENNNIIGLIGEDGSISMEPGGQLEFSPSPYKSIIEIKVILNLFNKIIKNICQKLKIRRIMIDIHPIKSISTFSIVPKKRFEILKKYISKTGQNSLDMMYKTSSLQINIDYKNQCDFVNKYRIMVLLSPIIVFLCKSKKKFNKRMIVWQNVDIERCRVPKFVFFDNFSYSKYINNILNVPIIFLFKKNEYIKIPKMTFLDYIKNGFNQNFATEMDFLNHLNGIFWIVRSKPQIEIRNTNINNLNFNCGIVAFIQGIIYNDKCFDKVYFLLREIGPMEISSIIKMISTNNLTEKYRKYLNKTTYDCLIIANNFLKSKKSNHFLKILFNNLEDI